LTLASFNALTADDAVALMLTCCASHRFARSMTAGRPYPSLAEAETAMGTAFESMTWDDVLEAMAGHPRIGARSVSAASAAEQSGVAEGSRAALAAGNAEYEERFGHVFLICATGLDGEQMLGALRGRLSNTADAERVAVTAELRKITLLRVRKALA
jgi:2-oxo-4-hydroxy-4-carboxy-5-ureidoimidazoline decarboxylase